MEVDDLRDPYIELTVAELARLINRAERVVTDRCAKGGYDCRQQRGRWLIRLHASTIAALRGAVHEPAAGPVIDIDAREILAALATRQEVEALVAARLEPLATDLAALGQRLKAIDARAGQLQRVTMPELLAGRSKDVERIAALEATVAQLQGRIEHSWFRR